MIRSKEMGCVGNTAYREQVNNAKNILFRPEGKYRLGDLGI
jgi:hypothetical protein